MAVEWYQRGAAVPEPFGLIHQGKSIDMPSQGNRSISKAPVASTWIIPATNAAACVLAGQVAQNGRNSQPPDPAVRNTRNSQLNFLSPDGMARIPKGSCSFAAGRRGLHRRGRWHGVVAYRVSRAR